METNLEYDAWTTRTQNLEDHNTRLREINAELLQALKWAAAFIPENKGNCRETVRVAIANAERKL